MLKALSGHANKLSGSAFKISPFGHRMLMVDTQTRRFASSTGFEASLHSEMSKMRVSPAAGWWLRAYGVLPSQVEASGPKGFLQKGDVLKHIKANNLSLRPQESAAPPKAEEPKQKAAPKKAAPAPKKSSASAASPVFNPDDPFQQIWDDKGVTDDHKEIADALNYSKRMLGHTYMSSAVDMSEIARSFPDMPTEAFVIRAAAKAFQRTISTDG